MISFYYTKHVIYIYIKYSYIRMKYINKVVSFTRDIFGKKILRKKLCTTQFCLNNFLKKKNLFCSRVLFEFRLKIFLEALLFETHANKI
jgi:hypothetical protein